MDNKIFESLIRHMVRGIRRLLRKTQKRKERESFIGIYLATETLKIQNKKEE